MSQSEELKGITRFHKVTIGAGVLFCLLMIGRYVLIWRRTQDSGYLVYALVAALGMIGLGAYLRRFSRSGI